MNTYILDTRTATPHFPGIGRYVANLARELPLLLNEQERLVMLEGEQGEDKKTRRKGEGEIERLAVGASPFSLSQQWQVPSLLRGYTQNPKSKADPGRIQNPKSLYHSPYYLMPYRPGVPTVLTFYDVIPIVYPEYVAVRARFLFRLFMRMACRSADQLVSISDAASQDLVRFFNVPASKITTTPLAPDPRFKPQSPSEIERIRQKYKLPESFILYFGINKPHKNLVTLVESFDKVSAHPVTLSPCHLVIAGAWDERYPEAKERAAPLGDAVRFLGRIDDADLPGLYAAATVFVFPSKYEGFGLPVLEAMACGIPVACSNTSSLPEVAGEAALLFDPENSSEIATAITRLLGDDSLRHDLRQRGLIQAQRFTWQRTAATTLDVYRDLLKFYSI